MQTYIRNFIHYDKVVISPEMQGWFIIYKSINGINLIKGFKDKYYLITSIKAEKAIDKICPCRVLWQKGGGMQSRMVNVERPSCPNILPSCPRRNTSTESGVS